MPLGVPVPGTAVATTVMSAAFYNTNVRDATTFLLNPPKFAATETSATALLANTWTLIPTGTIIQDTYVGASGGGYKAIVAGTYLVSGSICYSVNATGFRSASLAVNGTRVVGGGQDVQASPDFSIVGTKTVLLVLAVNDVVTIQGFSSVALSTSIAITDFRSRLDVLRVSS